jgi:fatty-acyl-CoA synthase
MMPTEMFAIDPMNWLRLMAERGATCTSGPPFAMEMARQRVRRTGERPDLSRLRTCCTGAEPVDARILRAFSAELLDGRQIFLPAYGMAEMTCVVSAGLPNAPLVTRHVKRPFTPGQPLIFTTADDPAAVEITGNGPPLKTNAYRIVDDAGRPLPDGVLGQIELRGDCMMSGYWRRSDATDEAFRDEGDARWLRSGDLGFTADGHIFIAGREKDVIIVRGRHFFPEELDALIQTIPGVRHRGVMTFGEVDPSGGPEQVTAVIETPDGFGELELSALDRAIRTRVADQLDLVLSRVVFTSKGSLPRTTSGKPRRSVARARWGVAANPNGPTP